jgi:TorA maturation chaperone TorD
MNATELKPTNVPIDEARERVYGFLAALLSHPDEGKWGRVLNAGQQREAITAADVIRASASEMKCTLGSNELPSTELDLRFLVVELCQPLEHLKADYERIFVDRLAPGCSPFELDHRERTDSFDLAESLADLAGIYRAFGFTAEKELPERPDHLAHELQFMAWLIGRGRLARRLAAVDGNAAEQARLCDLAQRNFFSDHLAGSVPALATGLQRATWGGYLEPLGRVLAAWIPLERHCFDPEPEFAKQAVSTERVPVGFQVSVNAGSRVGASMAKAPSPGLKRCCRA